MISSILLSIVRFLVGAYPRWQGCGPSAKQRIYFANHTSHVDTLALFSAIPRSFRPATRVVAARDYWCNSTLKQYVAENGFNAVFIDRKREDKKTDPLQPLCDVLAQGQSLIIFPEGTRGQDEKPGQFKSGLYHLAARFPQVELVPVYLDNLNRIMPKGSKFPVPLICTVHFGEPIQLAEHETKDEFLERARLAVEKMA
ncbi:MAG TPA: lysophospholipid acyltransferase family protein [Pseudomonadales bacterium]|nr:lysophospholipid acyltransferase family protein [Pseudomonadales bacterium]